MLQLRCDQPAACLLGILAALRLHLSFSLGCRKSLALARLARCRRAVFAGRRDNFELLHGTERFVRRPTAKNSRAEHSHCLWKILPIAVGENLLLLCEEDGAITLAGIEGSSRTCVRNAGAEL